MSKSMRKLTFCLTALTTLLSVAQVQAGQITMDAGGMISDAGSTPSGSGFNRDCAAGAVSDVGGNGSGLRGTTARPSTAVDADDEADSSAGDASSTGSSTAPGSIDLPLSINLPLKLRSNRWQSLVPGAIK